jgi:SAM-dependent methyltransferase
MRIPTIHEIFSVDFYLRLLRPTVLKPPRRVDPSYDAKLEGEQRFFTDNINTFNDLPEIFSYWSNKFLRPKAESLGFVRPEDLFELSFERAYHASPNAQRRFASIGAGICDTETSLAKALVAKGLTRFTIDCLDINEAMLTRGKQLAVEQGVGAQIMPLRGDFNHWQPKGRYDAILANQSLHHVTNLEGIFGSIDDSLEPWGLFVTSDMIGRNGHMRWPEALEIVNEFWRELPHEYRYNHARKTYDPVHENWDCSAVGFEGIRAQDILPLLVKMFDFDLFLGFGNLIFPFIDRVYGHNFDVKKQWDREFIDRVHQRDQQEMTVGRIKPTQMMAVMCSGRVGEHRYVDGMTPTFAIRDPSG